MSGERRNANQQDAWLEWLDERAGVGSATAASAEKAASWRALNDLMRSSRP